MARKREKLKHLDYNSREYWNRLLVQEGLSMSAGLHLDKETYVGDSQMLDLIQEDQWEKATGRKRPADRAE
jgi:hypothetical protein